MIWDPRYNTDLKYLKDQNHFIRIAGFIFNLFFGKMKEDKHFMNFKQNEEYKEFSILFHKKDKDDILYQRVVHLTEIFKIIKSIEQKDKI